MVKTEMHEIADRFLQDVCDNEWGTVSYSESFLRNMALMIVQTHQKPFAEILSIINATEKSDTEMTSSLEKIRAVCNRELCREK